MARTGAVLRAIAPLRNMTIAFELRHGPLTVAEMCRRTGLDEQTVRQVLPAMREAVTAARDPQGRVVLSLNSPQVACLIEAIRKYHDEI